MDAYWREYRKIEFKAAKSKRDIGHDVEQRLSNIIKNAISEKLKLFVKDFMQKKGDVIEEIVDLLLGCVPDILYQEAA